MSGQYKQLSELKPQLLENLENNILKFWSEKTIDQINGGFYGSVNAENKAVEEANKGVILNTRILWTFSAAYNHLKKTEYKLIADRAYQYITRNFHDKKFGGVFWELNYKSIPVNRRKQIYAQAFAIYSIAEYYKTNPQQSVLDEAINLFKLIEEKSLDTIKGGYIEAFGEDWTPIDDLRLSEKDLNAPKTMNTHLHILEAYTNLYSVWENDKLRVSLSNLIKLFHEKFLDERGHLILFFDNDWNKIDDLCSYGHDIEFSWLITEAAQILQDQVLIKESQNISEKLIKLTLREGIDTDGGLMSEFNYLNQSLDSDKHWWIQAEALVGFYNTYRINKSEKYLAAVLKSWQFIDRIMVDHENGEWYLKADKQGNIYPDQEKAGFWKCPYHNSRAMILLLKGIK